MAPNRYYRTVRYSIPVRRREPIFLTIHMQTRLIWLFCVLSYVCTSNMFMLQQLLSIFFNSLSKLMICQKSSLSPNKRSVISLDQLLNDPLTLSLFISLSPWPPKMKNCLGRSDVGKLGKYFTSLSDLDKIIQSMSSRS